MGDTGHHWVSLCPKPRCWSWFGGCPRVQAQRVAPTIDESSIHVHVQREYTIEGVEGAKGCRVWRSGERDGEQLSCSQGYDWGATSINSLFNACEKNMEPYR